MCKAYKMEEFPFDNLHGTEESNTLARQKAEDFCARHNGELVEMPGVMELRNGVACYKNYETSTAFLPAFCVRWEVLC